MTTLFSMIDIMTLLRWSASIWIVALCAAYFSWSRVEDLLRRRLVAALRAKLKVGVSLEGLSIRRTGIEIRGLLIENAPGEWSAPHAVQLDSFRFCTRPLAFLSLPGLVRLRFLPLEFCAGFRVKEIETIDIDGLTINLEDSMELNARTQSMDAADETSKPRKPSAQGEAIIKRGVVDKLPRSGIGATRRRLITLSQRHVQWFDEAKDPETAAPKGSLRLTATARVEPLSLDRGVVGSSAASARLVVACSGEELVLCAASAGERDEWVHAVGAVIRAIEPEGNAPWFEDFCAEKQRKKRAKLLAVQRRRQEWRRRWQPQAETKQADAADDGKAKGDEDGGGGGEDDDDDEDDGGDDDDDDNDGGDDADDDVASPKWLDSVRHSLFAQRQLPGAQFLAKLKEIQTRAQEQLAAQGTKWIEHGQSRACETRFEEAVEWQLGRLRVTRLALRINGQHLSLGAEGWELRGFVGSEAELKKRVIFGSVGRGGMRGGGALQTGLCTTLLKDSGTSRVQHEAAAAAEAVKRSVDDAVKRAQGGVASAVKVGAKGLTAIQEQIESAKKRLPLPGLAPAAAATPAALR